MFNAQGQNITGRFEAALVLADSIESWQSKGSGLIRGEENALEWQQGFIAGRFDLNRNWQAKAVINAYADGEKHLGFTQAYLQYKPLSPKQIKFKSKIGMFYPAMSIENTSEGWLSPYTYTQSAINSWIGEELRTIGGEAAWSSNGRRQGSPWSWELNLGIFKGNDPLGTLIAWRGFAMHDRQSLHHDKVQFAPVDSIININDIGSPTWLKPFVEIDGDWGAYIGFHLSYLRETNMRYYYYDNRADPNAINAERLYGWHTKFHSFALQHQLDANWRFMAQFLSGSTLMGNRSVFTDFVSAYLAASYATGKHRATVRIDYHAVNEEDTKPEDQNDSSGKGMTVAWRYQYTAVVELGAEVHQHRNDVANRAQLGLNQRQIQSQLRLVLAYTF
ncbi:hypothetical protein [Glaciecola sp. SC05]|uniref:hypothetical protein n=1 Tax=Glaciecola sp. SC05 TaxID=1987355 RepID=UPI003527DA33